MADIRQLAVIEVRDVLGVRLTAFLAGTKQASQVTRWADGDDVLPDAAFRVLYHASIICSILQERGDERATVQSWFKGMNPELDDGNPAIMLREGHYRDVKAAAQAFIQ